jgi:hypothetical protein
MNTRFAPLQPTNKQRVWNRQAAGLTGVKSVAAREVLQRLALRRDALAADSAEGYTIEQWPLGAQGTCRHRHT